MIIELTNFVKRQWKKDFSGTKLHNINENVILDIANDDLNEHIIIDHKSWNFCKYLIIDNSFYQLDINVASIKIDHTIWHYIETDYSSRNPSELAILSRFVRFPKGINYKMPQAKYIGLILYSKEQLEKEYLVNPSQEPFELSDDCNYGIVAIMGLNEKEFEPMLPITHMRNALGKEQGGNGEMLDIEEYNKSVEYWSKYILVK